MREIRLYCQEKPVVGAVVCLDQAARHHADKVLRLKVGDVVTLVHGDGQDYFAEVTQCTKPCFSLFVHRERRNPNIPRAPLVLGIALLKGEAMDRVLQKSVELGVSEVLLLHTEYSQRKFDLRRWQKKEPHWQGILRASALQCGRAEWPELTAPRHFTESLSLSAEVRWILSPDAYACQDCGSLRSDQIPSLTLLVGPEGGFAAQETAAAVAAGWSTQNLGGRILRADTAVVVGLVKAQILRGEIPC